MAHQDSMSKTMDKITDAAPFIAFVVACLAFTLVIIFKADYYTAVFNARWGFWPALAAGAVAGFATEAARAILLLLTFRDFRTGNRVGGFLGLVLSFTLVGYDCFSAGPISSVWTGQHAGNIGPIIVDIIVFLVTLSAGIELRLALSAPGKRNVAATSATNATPQRNAATGSNVAATSNGSANATQHGNGSQRYGNNAATPQPQRRNIGFQLGGATPPQQKPATGRNAVSNDVADDDALLLEEKLQKARNNLRAYESKKRNNKGNAATLQKGIDKWAQRVAELEVALQDVA